MVSPVFPSGCKPASGKKLYSLYKWRKINMYANILFFQRIYGNRNTPIKPRSLVHRFCHILPVSETHKCIKWSFLQRIFRQRIAWVRNKDSDKRRSSSRLEHLWAECRIAAFTFYLRITSIEGRIKNGNPHILLADIMLTFICLGHQVFLWNVTICFAF